MQRSENVDLKWFGLQLEIIVGFELENNEKDGVKDGNYGTYPFEGYWLTSSQR